MSDNKLTRLPRGVVVQDAQSITELARTHAPEAIETLVQIMRNGASDKARILAAMVILDRGFGRTLPGSIETPKAIEPSVAEDATKFGSLRGKVLDIINDQPERTWSARDLVDEMKEVAPTGVMSAILVQLHVDKFIDRVGPGKFQAIAKAEAV